MHNLIITSRFNLSNDDLNCLNLLYLPLIGSEATFLYTFLHSLLNKNDLVCDKLSVDDLLEILGWRLKKYRDAISKLEAINLINTYNKEEEIIILLLAPLTPKNFLSDSNYGTYLNGQVREEIYEFLASKFILKPLSLEGFKNVSKTFDEVFKYEVYEGVKSDNNLYLGKKPNKGSIINNYNFDIDLFLENINKEYLPEIISNDLKKKIIAVAYAYGFLLEQMVNLYNDSITENKEFNFELFKKNAAKLYTYLTNKKHPTLEVKEDDDVILFLDNVSAEELLNNLIDGDYLEAPYLKKVLELYENLNLPRGVINAMIMYVYNEKGNIPTLNYFKKVADSWFDKGILTTSDALKFMLQGEVKEESVSYKSKKNKKVDQSKLEDWQKDYFENMMKEFDNNEKA